MSKTIGIIGSGQTADNLIRLFSNSTNIRISFLIKTSQDEVAIPLAKKLHIPVDNTIEMVMKEKEPDFIIDTIGSDELLDRVFAVRKRAKILTLDVAILFADVLNERQAALGDMLRHDLSELKCKISSNISDILKTSNIINKISNELEVLAINAGIQASRAGSFGKGFAVVAGEVKSTARSARTLSEDIDNIVNEISGVTADIERSLSR
jgi:hypothetical protein